MKTRIYSVSRTITNSRTNAVEYDETSYIPSIAALSMRGVVDPRLKHNNGQCVDINLLNDPIAISQAASYAEGLVRGAVDKFGDTVPEPSVTPEPEPSKNQEVE